MLRRESPQGTHQTCASHRDANLSYLFSFSPFASAATINEMLIRSLINQSELLYDIYNYTLMIPDLSLMLQQKLNLSTGQTTETDGSSLKVITAKPGKLTT